MIKDFTITLVHRGILKLANPYRYGIEEDQLALLQSVIPGFDGVAYLKFNGYEWHLKTTENHITILRLKSKWKVIEHAR
jgi:hypothetical protein